MQKVLIFRTERCTVLVYVHNISLVRKNLERCFDGAVTKLGYGADGREFESSLASYRLENFLCPPSNNGSRSLKDKAAKGEGCASLS